MKEALLDHDPRGPRGPHRGQFRLDLREGLIPFRQTGFQSVNLLLTGLGFFVEAVQLCGHVGVPDQAAPLIDPVHLANDHDGQDG